MSGGVHVGSVNSAGTATDSVILTASGSVQQRNAADGMGLTAESLKVEADGDVKLGVIGTTGADMGNDIGNADIVTGGSLALGLINRDARVTVNSGNGGFVNGSLSIHAQNVGVTLNNDLKVKDQAQLYGSFVLLPNLQAGENVYISTAVYDSTAEDGIKAGRITGREVGFMTGEGSISVDSLIAEQGRADVYRTAIGVPGTITIVSGQAAGTAMIFNADGDIRTTFHAGGALNAFTGSGGTFANSKLTSSEERVAMITNAERIAGYLSDKYVTGLPIGSMADGLFPMIDFNSLLKNELNEPNRMMTQTGVVFVDRTISEEKPVEDDGNVTNQWGEQFDAPGWEQVTLMQK